MTEVQGPAAGRSSVADVVVEGGPEAKPGGGRRFSTLSPSRWAPWIPTWAMITTKNLELRKRRGLMVVLVLLTLGLPFLVLGFRLVFHAVDPAHYGPAGTPSVFQALCNPMTEFGFIIAATLGATVGTTDLSEGVFRHLVVTGRSRLALYLARIPAGLSMVVALVAVAFAALCLVTAYEGVPQPATLNANGVFVPVGLDQGQLETWLLAHPHEVIQAALANGSVNATSGPVGIRVEPKGVVGPASLTVGQVRSLVHHSISSLYSGYVSDEIAQLNPPINEMVKIGLWIELQVFVGFTVGLGLGSLIGQRTVATILMIVLEIILTPILISVRIPYFLDGQRTVVGVALEQLRPAGLVSMGGRVFGGRGLSIPPMPTWAMVTVIVGWIVGWSVIGAWRMMTRDA
jgi:hypothetical protein